MKVRQRYRKWPPAKEYRGKGFQKVSLRKPWTEDLPILTQKHVYAFAPNFVHSLDATHMMMTALACADRDIAFTAVHDSFWTHASDMDTLRDILGKKLREIHPSGEGQLERLHRELRGAYPGVDFDAPSDTGYASELDRSIIPNTPYFVK